MAAKLWWMIQKDLVSEWRTRRVWPAMLLLGAVVAMLFGLEMDLPQDQRPPVVGGLLWLAIFFAGMVAVDRSLAAEREEGCWDGLLLCPVSPTAIYFAKLAANAVALAGLQAVLVPLFAVLAGLPVADHPWAMLLVALLGNLGITSAGTLLSALTAGIRQNSGLLILLVLPVVMPVVLAAAAATRLLCENHLNAECWRWVQLLGVMAVVFIGTGAILFDYVVEE
jgi:heme exporter protein B